MKRFLLFVVLGIVATFWMRTRPCPLEASSARYHAIATAQAYAGSVGAEDRPGPRELVDEIPVPIVPGTRVINAAIEPPTAPEPPERPERAERPRRSGRRGHEAKPVPVKTVAVTNISVPRSIAGRLSATETRAKADARLQLDREVAEWLVPEIPPSWKAPDDLVNQLVTKIHVKPIAKDYGTVYEATLDVNLSSQHRATFLEAYYNDVVRHRLASLGALLGFILTCLAALAGYIRADEATKGYYTNGLRAVAAAGVGAAGVLLYQLMT